MWQILPKAVLASISQFAVMAAIVATMLYLPLGATLALGLRLFGVSLYAFVTFGGALNTLAGLAAWWLIAFAGAGVYAAYAFPWEDKVVAWPRKN